MAAGSMRLHRVMLSQFQQNQKQKLTTLMRQSGLRRCSNCRQLQTTISRKKITHCPPVVIVQLQRFDSAYTKIDCAVSFPVSGLDLRPCLDDKPAIYDLIGVINYIGSGTSGHYVAFCKRNKNWFVFDDAKVTLLNSDDIETEAADTLFYQRRKTPDEESVSKVTSSAKATIRSKNLKKLNRLKQQALLAISRKSLDRACLQKFRQKQVGLLMPSKEAAINSHGCLKTVCCIKVLRDPCLNKVGRLEKEYLPSDNNKNNIEPSNKTNNNADNNISLFARTDIQ